VRDHHLAGTAFVVVAGTILNIDDALTK